MPAYAPPTADEVSPIDTDPRAFAANPLGNRLARHYASRERGKNVYRTSLGDYTTIQPATAAEIDKVFHGGHNIPVTPAERTAIEASGVGGTFTTFDPRVIPGLVWWLAADQLSGYADGDPVASWPSAFEDTHIPPLTQTTTSKQPLYKTNVVNGHPVVRFDGVDDYMDSDNWPMEVNEPYTLLMVIASAVGVSGQTIFDNLLLNAGPRSILSHQSDGTLVYITIASNTTAALVQFRSTAAVITTPIVLTVTLDDTITPLVRITGVDVAGAITRGVGFLNQPHGFARLRLGASRVPSNFASFDLAELALWQGVLPADQISFLETDLIAKYAL